MKLRLILSFAIVLVLAAGVGIGWYLSQMLTPPPTADATPKPTVQTVHGESVITVSPEAQKASRIEVSRLTSTMTQQDLTAYATVIDLQPLFNLRNQLATAQADIASLSAQAANSQAQYERSRQLFNDDRNISQKSLQDAQSVLQSDQAKLKAARAALPELTAAIRQQFGETMTQTAIMSKSDLMQQLQLGKAVILRVTLPSSVSAPNQINVQAADGKVIQAQKLSASPQADPTIQGNPWLYVVQQSLPTNLRLNARIPLVGQSNSSIVIPEQAIVWYGGQSWAYVRTASNQFTRRYVSASDEMGQGFIAGSNFHAGDAVVIQGAQLLLSEELKPQGINTICKDPPECDG